MSERTKFGERLQQLDERREQEAQQMIGYWANLCDQTTRRAKEKREELGERVAKYANEKLDNFTGHASQQAKHFFNRLGLDGDKAVTKIQDKAQEYGHNAVILVKVSPWLLPVFVRGSEELLAGLTDSAYDELNQRIVQPCKKKLKYFRQSNSNNQEASTPKSFLSSSKNRRQKPSG